ncbi:MAG: hypothetical protein RL060_1391 [Bacteroidota bacterium]
MSKYFKMILCVVLAYLSVTQVYPWGFYAHKKINHIAVYSLPEGMFKFYKTHLHELTEKATAPDKRRYLIKEEAARHYIDMEDYGDSALYKLPHHLFQIKKQFTDDSLMKMGMVPWHIQQVCYSLTKAFLEHNQNDIIRLSADLGHYVADANVPLHTTKNYNGQLSNQHGIHGFWESRLPELYANQYDLFTGKALYVNSIADFTWQIVLRSHLALDSVLTFEKELSLQCREDKKYSFEQRGATTIKVYAKKYAKAYHQRLAGQVERQMKSAIACTAALWYTCWINAGQPNLDQAILHGTDSESEDTLKPIRNNETIRPETHVLSEEMHTCAHQHACCESPTEMRSPKWFTLLTQSIASFKAMLK